MSQYSFTSGKDYPAFVWTEYQLPNGSIVSSGSLEVANDAERRLQLANLVTWSKAKIDASLVVIPPPVTTTNYAPNTTTSTTPAAYNRGDYTLFATYNFQ